MGTTQPIRDPRQLSQFINYYATTQPNQRNYTLIVIGLHTALRISDILTLQWKMYLISKQQNAVRICRS